MNQALAIDGGTPLRAVPMPTWPAPGDEEIAAAESVLRSGRLNYWTGQEARAFEQDYAESLGRKHGIAVSNGTVALEVCLRAFGIGAGDEVVVPSRTFIATASSVVSVGATPVIADIDRDSSCMTADSVRTVLTDRTRAVIPVHLGGWPVDMDPMMALAQEHDLVVIEDCAQAHGARYGDRPVGSIGHAAAFSFCQDKILPTGEGGMIVTDDERAFVAAWEYKDHGKSLRKVNDPTFAPGTTSYKWLVDSFGTNARMGEVEAAIGRVGLRNLPAWVDRRRRNAMRIAEGISTLDALRAPLPEPGVDHAFYRLYTYVRPEMLAEGWDRDRIALAIAAEGVPCQYGSCAEIYREEAFAKAGLGPDQRLPVASEIHETSLAFFVHPTLGDAEIDDTVAAVRRVFSAATKRR